ncbi:UNVERIFIED_CONTAM: Phospholipase A1-Igamma2, chloroplastic [Sesamum radiatum]|uniref:Phospholipase A1-Igamma2, chloroplastic n=1 Tax=Sesamum radiatum TaxID=300843 RepID=A0AAW2UUU1_SESRA
MANSLSNTALTFTTPLFQPQKQCSFPVLAQKFQPASPSILDQLSTRRLTPSPAVSKTKEELSSIIHKLEREESTAKAKQRNERELADCWREMLGEDDWAGLLDPMDPLLRNELIRYGVKAQACYDAFDFDPYSKYCGSCRFTRREFFERLGLAEAGYDVTRVESGFLDLYTDKDESCKYCKFSAREQILTEMNRLINEVYPKEEVSVTITGHSLGGALALLSAYDIVETGINVRGDSRAVPVCAFTFAGPRVGNARFKARLELLGVKVLRVVNVHDVVPKSPGLLVNEKVHPLVMKMAENFPWSYVHVGVELALDHKNSPFLRPDGDLVCAHNLEAHLHLLDGYQGRGERFVLNGRDYALVNKACDFLKDEFEIPPSWRQDHNKGMVKNKEGRWVQQERAVHDDHPGDMHHHLNKLGLPSNNI